MDRRTFLKTAAVLPWLPYASVFGDAGAKAFVEPWFPDVGHKFVWRNWDLVPLSRIAQALECDAERVVQAAATMGLKIPQPLINYPERTWFKVLRRNWDFVPFQQITVLLDRREAQIRQMMLPFNFVENHLGPKPVCPIVRLDAAAANDVRVIDHFDVPDLIEESEPRFAFLDHLKNPIEPGPWASDEGEPRVAPRIVFPYTAFYGDDLNEPDIDAFYPDDLLANIRRMGLDSIWVHGMFRELIPSAIFPEFGHEGTRRLDNLNLIIKKAARHGLGVYLFLNEPRGVPAAFFEKNPDVRGAEGRPTDVLISMCTSTQKVKDYLAEASELLMRNAPGLAGIILITASEAPTNCYSIHRETPCQRCANRNAPEVIGEVVTLISKGVHHVKPSANVIAWDWSWTVFEDDPQTETISQLPDEVTLMVDFERGTPIERGGVRGLVDEYSLSTVGPSPRAAAHIAQARARGMNVMAKIQVGTTWESGLLPYLPVAPLVVQKLEAMAQSGINGAMMSWTLGTYPSPNWQVAQAFYHKPIPETSRILREVAADLYGDKAVTQVLQAWDIFVEAFQQYPFSIPVVYSSIVQCGPAHAMYFEPTGKRPGIINSHDTLHWTRPYGPAIVADAFDDMAQGWQRGLDKLEDALSRVPSDKKAHASKDYGISHAAYLNFKSIANQVRFLMLRAQWHKEPAALNDMAALIDDEIDRATQLHNIAQADSRVGFEPSMQYFYLPLDIRERIVACRYIRSHAIPAARAGVLPQ